MDNKLIIPSCKGLLDAFHTTVDRRNNSVAYLVAPRCGFQDLSEMELLNLAEKPKEAGSISHSVFVLGVFSYLFTLGGMREDEPTEIKVSKLKDYLGLSRSSNNKYPLTERLLEMNEISAVWNRSELDKLAVVTLGTKNKVTIESTYFHKLANHMLESTRDEETKKRSSFYTDLVHSNIVNERNRAAVEIVIELVKILVRRGNCFGDPPHISINKLIDRCPELMRKTLQARSVSRQNAILRADVTKALELLVCKTDCYKMYNKLNVLIPEGYDLSVKNGKALIEMPHKGNLYNIKRKAASNGKEFI